MVGQLVFRNYLPARASLAGANGISAAMGWKNGVGMTIGPAEAIAIKQSEPSLDARDVFDARGDRLPLYEPLPGFVFILLLIGSLGVSFTLNLITAIQIALVATSAALLASELAHRNPVLGYLAGFAWALFVPVYRLSIAVDYEIWLSILVMVGVVSLLKYQRTSDRRWLVVAGLTFGFGLWIRSYFILYVLGHAAVVWLLTRRRGKLIPDFLHWAVPVILLAIGLTLVKDPVSSGTPLTRGAFWHTFWMGVGQFDNDVIGGFTDLDVCELAVELGYGPIPCQDTYLNDLPYLYQYEDEYNAVLGQHARVWISQNVPQFALNTLGRLWWLAAPGFMPSTRIESDPTAALLVRIIAVVILALAIVGLVVNWTAAREELLIFLGTYLALAPLTIYYMNSKVPTVVYFCVLVIACYGLLAVWNRARSRVRQQAI